MANDLRSPFGREEPAFPIHTDVLLRRCAVEGCVKIRKGTARFCSSHAHRRTRYGDPLGKSTSRLIDPDRKCGQEGCNKPYKCGGYCDTHYSRMRAGSPLDTPIKIRSYGGSLCSVDGCPVKASSSGYCERHYRTFKKYGNALVSKKIIGKGWHTSRGYKYLHITKYIPGSFTQGKDRKKWVILEHRHVMQEMLGRSLIDGENVHHINGVRDDNRPENLELWISTQPVGQRVEDHLAWAREIINRYGDLVEKSALNIQTPRKSRNGKQHA